MSTRFILSIDGGGIRGLIPAKLLSFIEQSTGSPIARLFDLIAGTSTGGILALGLAKPDADGRPAYSAEELTYLYSDEGPKIFHPSIWTQMLQGAFEEKYSAAGLEEVLNRYFGKTRVSDALTKVMVTSYDIELRRPYFFKSWDVAPGDQTGNYLMKDAARATTAAPTYFEPALIGRDDRPDRHALIDGGVVANSPALCALAEAKRTWPDDDYFVVALGTGKLTRCFRYQDAQGWGALGWARRIIDVVFDGVDKAVDYQMDHLLPPIEGRCRYHRFQADLTLAFDDLDRADEENLRSLHLQADGLISDCLDELRTVCRQLTDRDTTQPADPR